MREYREWNVRKGTRLSSHPFFSRQYVPLTSLSLSLSLYRLTRVAGKLFAAPIMRHIPVPIPAATPKLAGSQTNAAAAHAAVVAANALRLQRANAAALAASNRMKGRPQVAPILDFPKPPAMTAARAKEEADVARARAKKAARKVEDQARQARMTATMAKMADQRGAGVGGGGGSQGSSGKRENPADPGSAAFHKRQSAEKKRAAESRREALMGRTNVGGVGASASGSGSSSTSGGNGRMQLDPKRMGGTSFPLSPSLSFSY